MKKNMLQAYALLFSGVLLVSGCSTMSDSKQKKWNRMADRTLAKVVLAYPGLQAELGMASGYLALARSGSGIPMVGKRGSGVLTAVFSGERSYVRITELEVDGAWGVGDYSGLMMIHDPKAFEQARSAGLEWENKGTIYIFSEGESIAAYTIRKIRIEPMNP